jgi:hypothetical protein
MEDTLPEIESQTFQKKHLQDIFSELQTTIEQAADTRDLELIDDPLVRKALSIVETFLRRKHRICYGGMAINAHLPPKLKFYDFNKTLPDYDFFTPAANEDVEELLYQLHTSGLTDAVARVGIHEGTTKIFVNYTGVADITEMPIWLYTTLYKRSIKDDGITYADADFLRMNMYLELSRPRGEVERWEKVYKRLLLLNAAKSPEKCGDGKGKLTHVNPQIHASIIEYISNKQLIFVGSELKRVYANPTSLAAGYILKSTSPVVAYASTPDYHVATIRQLVREHEPDANVQTVHWKARGEMLPELYGVLLNGRVIVLLIQEGYCHAYNTVSLPNKKQLRIASLDTAITLYYTLSFVKGLDGIVPRSVHCFANTLVDISRKTRDEGVPSKFPLFTTTCHGHQPTKISLLRAKAKRIASMKRKAKSPRTKTHKRPH